jgi:D-3-phosphoglycerate dehydrogenase
LGFSLRRLVSRNKFFLLEKVLTPRIIPSVINNLIIDFDSTIVAAETLEVMFEVATDGRAEREVILDRVRKITEEGMRGQIPFSQSLQRRLAELKLSEEHIPRVIDAIRPKISQSFVEVFGELELYNIQIISGGFQEVIEPILAPFKVKPNQIHANRLIFMNGTLRGVDTYRSLCEDLGKVKAIEALELTGETLVVGDGYTDYEIKSAGLADGFIYYGEFVNRPEVIAFADRIALNFYDVVKFARELS